jgi:hypothetical protein
MKIGPKYLRIPIYGLCICLAFYCAHILGRIEEKKQRELDIKVMKGQIDAFWELEKEKVTLINKLAELKIRERELKPGDPLPPNSLLQKGVNLSALQKPTATKVLNTYSAASGEYSTKANSLITVLNKVPPEGESYAYGGIEHNREMYGKKYSTYPEDQFAYKRLKEALREVEETQKKENESKE